MARRLVILLMVGLISSCSASGPLGQAHQSPSTTPVGRAGEKGSVIQFQCGSTYEVGDIYRQGCQSDDDCQIVRGDCCGCSAAGTKSVILSRFVYDASLCEIEKCQMTMCAQMISTDKSCLLNRAMCNNGKCELG